MANLKKNLQKRQRKERDIADKCKDIISLGSFLNVCFDKHFDTQKYKIAKKRYVDNLKDIINVLNDLALEVEVQEKDVKKSKIYEKMNDERKKEAEAQKEKEKKGWLRLGKS